MGRTIYIPNRSNLHLLQLVKLTFASTMCTLTVTQNGTEGVFNYIEIDCLNGIYSFVLPLLGTTQELNQRSGFSWQILHTGNVELLSDLSSVVILVNLKLDCA